MTDYDALRKAAEGATPGPWWDRATDPDAPHYGDFGWYVPGSPAGETVDSLQGRADAAYIAAASPDVVLALLDEVAGLRAKVARVEALIEHRETLTEASLARTFDGGSFGVWISADEVRSALIALDGSNDDRGAEG